MRLVLPANSSITILGLTFILACSSSVPRNLESPAGTNVVPVLELRQIGVYGPTLNSRVSLLEPSGVTVSRIGDIFISDRSANAVYRFSRDFRFISDEGGIGAAIGSFNRPMGLSCDQALNLYVADSGNRRIQILDRNLRFVGAIDSYYDDAGEALKFYQPTDIEIDREGNFWVADNDKVLKLNPFYELYQEMSYNAPGNFRIGQVSSIDISTADLLAMGDPGNMQVIIANINGNFVNEFEAGRPAGVAWGGDGLLWIADAATGRIDAYDKTGTRIFQYSENSPGFKPSAVAFDLSGRLIVLDSGQRRIYHYEIIRGSRQ